MSWQRNICENCDSQNTLTRQDGSYYCRKCGFTNQKKKKAEVPKN